MRNASSSRMSSVAMVPSLKEYDIPPSMTSEASKQRERISICSAKPRGLRSPGKGSVPSDTGSRIVYPINDTANFDQKSDVS